MRLSELQHKDIVDLEGNKIGNIIDVVIDRDGRIIYFILEEKSNFLKFRKDVEIKISWDKIEKIGEDVILIKM